MLKPGLTGNQELLMAARMQQVAKANKIFYGRFGVEFFDPIGAKVRITVKMTVLVAEL